MKAYEFESVKETRRQMHEQFRFFREMLGENNSSPQQANAPQRIPDLLQQLQPYLREGYLCRADGQHLQWLGFPFEGATGWLSFRGTHGYRIPEKGSLVASPEFETVDLVLIGQSPFRDVFRKRRRLGYQFLRKISLTEALELSYLQEEQIAPHYEVTLRAALNLLLDHRMNMRLTQPVQTPWS